MDIAVCGLPGGGPGRLLGAGAFNPDFGWLYRSEALWRFFGLYAYFGLFGGLLLGLILLGVFARRRRQGATLA